MQKNETRTSTKLSRYLDNYIARCKRYDFNQDLKSLQDADLKTLCRMYGDPQTACFLHYNLHNCKEGMMTIFDGVSDTVLCEGWTYMFTVNAMLLVCSPKNVYLTYWVQSIDWEKGTFVTEGKEVRFILETTRHWRARKRAEAAASIVQPCEEITAQQIS